MKQLCIDFDGVLHLYPQGQVVPGAVEFLENAVQEFEVQIFSTRSAFGQIDYMKQCLRQWGVSESCMSKIAWPTMKPPAYIFLDDRAICFMGIFPSMEDLHAFKSWQGI